MVARAIAREGMGAGRASRGWCIWICAMCSGIDLHQRFPGISALLARYGLDLARDLIPVRPAAHYLMGGIRTDLAGRTSLRGLYAAGEAACTGVHGANRLASNSLLEGLVFGARAAQAMLADGLPLADGRMGQPREQLARRDEQLGRARIADLQAPCGPVRDCCAMRPRCGRGWRRRQNCSARLAAACGSGSRVRAGSGRHRRCARVAHAILHSALARTESRGAHFRNDYPRRDDANFCKHSVLPQTSALFPILERQAAASARRLVRQLILTDMHPLQRTSCEARRQLRNSQTIWANRPNPSVR